MAGLALTAGQNGKKLLAAVLALLMLPVLVVLMLPGLIFGDLTSSGALALNDDAALSSQMSAVVSTVDTVLLEGIAEAVFHLTDAQKSLANNYAENLRVFLGDGPFQHTKCSGSMVDALGDVRFTDGATEVVYFNQLDQRWANLPYGTDNILNEAGHRAGAGGPFWIIGP